VDWSEAAANSLLKKVNMSLDNDKDADCKADSPGGTWFTTKLWPWFKASLWPALLAGVSLVVVGFVAGQLEDTLDLFTKSVDKCSAWYPWVRSFAKAYLYGLHLGFVPALVVAIAVWPLADKIDKIILAMLIATISALLILITPPIIALIVLLIFLRIATIWQIAVMTLILISAYCFIFNDVRGGLIQLVQRLCRGCANAFRWNPIKENKKLSLVFDKFRWLLLDRIWLCALIFICGCIYPHWLLLSESDTAQKDTLAKICLTGK
jgi:hypothetical protein